MERYNAAITNLYIGRDRRLASALASVERINDAKGVEYHPRITVRMEIQVRIRVRIKGGAVVHHMICGHMRTRCNGKGESLPLLCQVFRFDWQTRILLRPIEVVMK